MSTTAPANRLREIAQRRLDALGVPTRPSQDGAFLEGELVGLVRNPFGGKPLERVRFVVEGHDRLRPVEPRALEGLPPVSFIDLQRPEPIFERLEKLLQRRYEAARAALAEMRRLRLEASLDGELCRAVGRLELTSLGHVIVEADERGVRAARVEPLMGSRAPAPLDLPVDLREHEHRVDLELFLYGPAEEALKAPVAAPAPGPQRPAPTGEGGPTLAQLVEKFGPDARVGPGLTLTRDLDVGGRQVRFLAIWDAKRGFVGRLTSGSGTVWEEPFPFDRLPRVEELAAAKLGVPAPPPPPSPFSLGPSAAVTPDMIAGQLEPVVGEVWVMSILVEAETGNEVRYVPVDIDGKPFGAPRTLGRADFLATFERAGSVGFRLPVRVLQVTSTHVTWVQLDPAREPVGHPKNGALGMFVNHFVPEAAAY